MDNYEKFIREARGMRLDTENTEDLKARILESTAPGKKGSRENLLVTFLFGWTEIPWLRNGMVIASLTVVIVIFIQQFIIVDRVDSLENRIISINTENILSYQKEMMHANANLVTMSDEIFAGDSVKVAGKDLATLIKSYRELQARYEELLEIVESSNSRKPGSQLPESNKLKL